MQDRSSVLFILIFLLLVASTAVAATKQPNSSTINLEEVPPVVVERAQLFAQQEGEPAEAPEVKEAKEAAEGTLTGRLIQVSAQVVVVREAATKAEKTPITAHPMGQDSRPAAPNTHPPRRMKRARVPRMARFNRLAPQSAAYRIAAESGRPDRPVRPGGSSGLLGPFQVQTGYIGNSLYRQHG